MTREQTKQFLMVMSTAYPNYKPPDKSMAIDLWYAMLGEYDYQTLILTLQAYIATDTSGFAPSIGQLLDKMRSLRPTNELTGMEAWSMVSKALRNSAYHSQEEFDRLPPEVQRGVGSAKMLYIWGTDENYNESVVMSQFLKSYKQAVEQQEEWEALPNNIQRLIEKTIDRLEG